MKLSINKFKSIKDLQNFEIKPLTVITGMNCSGKSSFLELLLLLKQTIELDSSNQPLVLSGEFYKIKEFQDILYDHNPKNQLSISFLFNKAEFSKIDKPKTIFLFNTFNDYQCLVKIQYNIYDNKEFINHFSIKFSFPDGNKQYVIFGVDTENIYSIETNTVIFDKKIWTDNPTITNIHFSSIYPTYYEGEKEVKCDENGPKKFESFKELINIDDIKIMINSFFQNISYLGPLREQPKDEYFISKSYKNVGTKGEFVARILDEFANEKIQFNKIIEQENGIKYDDMTMSLAEAVKYWMCEVFDVAEDIHVEKINDSYKIILMNKSGLTTSIKHVGFGISQLLPIVIEGLRMPKNGTLILEQPENHLHPKVQSLLYDFLYGLTLQGKTVIVETHSSHFITRMRRRIAEDESNKMDNYINLTFIENNIFRTIELNDYGTLDYYPEDFIEPSNAELRAIVKAQMNKRAKKRDTT